MDLITLFTLAVGLSMDAFAVAVCKGLAMKKITVGKAVIVGLWFGGFQALMPALGYFLGIQFQDKITAVDHWIAFILLGLIGANMIREAFSKEEEAECGVCSEEEASLGVREMFVLAVATSIDALAVGITFAFLRVNIWAAVSFIGAVHRRRKSGKCFRRQIQIQSRTGRRRDSDSSGAENSAGAPGDSVKVLPGIFWGKEKPAAIFAGRAR